MKSIPLELKSTILHKLHEFQESLYEAEGKIRDLPAGYWIRKVKNTDIYKFRLNNSDRILFKFLPKRADSKDFILFLHYVTHDEQIRKANHITQTDLTININAFHEEDLDEKVTQTIEKEFLNNTLHDIPAIVVDDEQISLILDETNEDYIYYVSEEQYAPLTAFGQPIILSGAGGTGKTVVVLNKLIDLASKNIKSVYFSYNNLLVQETKKTFQKFYSGDAVSAADFYSIKSFYKKHCHVNDDQIVEYYEFVKWFHDEKYKIKGLKGIDELAIWTEIRGILKGYLGLEYSEVPVILQATSSRMLSLQQYKDLPKNYSKFTDVEKEAIFNVALAYQKWLSHNNLYDENDLAAQLIRLVHEDKIEKYQYLIVDEIQDVSETQLYLLSSLVHDATNVLFSGDVHQTINPTFFNFGRIKNLYFTNQLQVEDFNLTKNYRNTKEITNLTNTLKDMRQQFIGKTAYDYEVTAIQSGERPVILNETVQNIGPILEAIKDKHYAALIVTDELEKEKLATIYEEARGRIFTINEIKGLEYETVFCYNLFSSFKEAWNKILTGSAKKQEQYRYYFNLFYVAISRAKDFLCILENDVQCIHTLLQQKCIVMNTFEPERFNIEKKSSEKDWTKESQRLETIGNKEKSTLARDFTREAEIQKFNEQMYSIERGIAFPGDESIDLNIEKDHFYLNEGIKNLRIRRYSEATTHLNKYIEQYPEDADGYYYLGLVYTYSIAGIDYSIRYFDEALRMKPDWYEVYLDKASSLKFVGRLEETMNTLDKAISVDPTIGNAYYIKGLVYLDQNKFQLAADHFEKAIKRPCYTFDGVNKSWNSKPPKAHESQFKNNIRGDLQLCKKVLGYRYVQNKDDTYNPQKIKMPIDYNLLTVDLQKNIVSHCTVGQSPLESTYNGNAKKYVVKFDKPYCQKCENFKRCPMKQSDEGGKVVIRKKFLANK